MKMKLVTTAALFAAMVLAAPSAHAITAAQSKAIKKAINSVPAPELPATAAELVAKASKEDREAVAVTAVRAAIYKSRSSARLVVSAVVKAAPDMAGPVTLAASEMEGAQAGLIASAAISAAPAAKTEIVSMANQGATLATVGGTSVAANTTAGSTVTVNPSATASTVSSGVSGRTVVPRVSTATPAGGTVTQSNTPINGSTGGAGNGSFQGASATPAGTPTPVDYTQPRS